MKSRIDIFPPKWQIPGIQCGLKPNHWLLLTILWHEMPIIYHNPSHYHPWGLRVDRPMSLSRFVGLVDSIQSANLFWCDVVITDGDDRFNLFGNFGRIFIWKTVWHAKIWRYIPMECKTRDVITERSAKLN